LFWFPARPGRSAPEFAHSIYLVYAALKAKRGFAIRAAFQRNTAQITRAENWLGSDFLGPHLSRSRRLCKAFERIGSKDDAFPEGHPASDARAKCPRFDSPLAKD
jgi:hypothetical protein